MQSMSCADKVDMSFPRDRDNEQYGIEIQVKYRATEKLRIFDRFFQVVIELLPLLCTVSHGNIYHKYHSVVSRYGSKQ